MVVLAGCALFGVAGAATAAAPDLTGTWNCCGGGGAAAQDFVITSGRGALSGSAVLPGGRVFATITGSVTGNRVTIVTTYNSFAPGYVATLVGTLSAGGDSMAGSWTSNQRQSGTWTATRRGEKKPSVSVAVNAAAPDAGVGATVGVTVKVTAGAKKLGSVTLGKGLLVGGEAAKIISTPPGLGSFSLAAGASRSFSFTVKGVKLGTATLSASASARSGATTVGASGSDTLKIGRGALAISIVSVAEKTTLSTFPLKVSDKGKVSPRNVTVKVKLTNTSRLKIEGVSFESLRPVPVDKTQPLDQLGFARGTFPLKLGTFAPGSTATRTFTLEVTGDGKYELRALVLFKDSGTAKGSGVLTATGGKFEATVPPLFFTGKLNDDGLTDRGGGKWVKGGRGFFISGDVKNISTWRHLCLRPLVATKRGNADAVGPVDIAIYGRMANTPPLAGGLKPGQDVLWGLWVGTRALGGTRATVTLDPGAAEVDPRSSCDVEQVLKLKPLKPAEVTKTKDSTSFVVHVDVSVPTFPELGKIGATWNFFMGVPLGVVVGLGEWIQGTIATARELVRENLTPEGLLKNLVGSLPPVAYAQVMAQVYGSMAKTVEVLSHYWETASEVEKQSLISHVQSVLLRGRDDAWKSTAAGVGKIFSGFMQNVEAAYANPNDPDAWRALGTTTAGGTTKFVVDMAIAELGLRLAKISPQLAQTFVRIGDESVTYKALREMPAGKLVNLTELRELWGFAKSDIVAFGTIAKEEGVVIGIRGRSPKSVANLEEGAVWKHENVKPKNVSPLDWKYLGFDKADEGLVAFKRYSTAEKAAIEARIARAPITAAERVELLKRAETRFEEADLYLAKLDKASKKGVIDIGFNYSENGIGKPTSPKPRGFKLLVQQEASGSSYFRPLQENPLLTVGKLPKWCREVLAKVLCRLTGDMDGVYLASPQGTPLPLDKLLKVYKRLERAGWQHPETFTWVEQMTGAFWFKAKEKILKGLQVGGESMVEFGPDGIPRATHIDLAKSRLLGTANWYVDIVGGFTAAVR